MPQKDSSNAKIRYNKHKREYSVVGITAAFHSLFRQPFVDFCGTTLKENLIVVKDGIFYHFQQEGDRLRIVQSYMKRINEGALDLEGEFASFKTLVKEYKAFLATDEKDYTKETFLQFTQFYQKMWNLAYIACDSLDAIDVLDEEKREAYEKWTLQVRLLAEPLYKEGELEFVPKYLAWLASHVAPDYTAEELNYLIFTELEAFATGEKPLPSREELQRRKKCLFVRSTPNDTLTYCSGKEAEKIIDNLALFVEENYDNVEEVQGKTAQGGLVTGRVCIVTSKDEMKKFSSGDVLVSTMTQPSFLPIMKEAAAIVTDEGGVLCHAAIVARELKIPCITGTRISTAVFTDGDRVEVDATNGVVRKVGT